MIVVEGVFDSVNFKDEICVVIFVEYGLSMRIVFFASLLSNKLVMLYLMILIGRVLLLRFGFNVR